MDFFTRTVLPHRLSLVSKVRLKGYGYDLANTFLAIFTARRIRELLDKFTGLKELRFVLPLSPEDEWSTLLRTELEEKGIDIYSPPFPPSDDFG